jgi:hypothetical protein
MNGNKPLFGGQIIKKAEKSDENGLPDSGRYGLKTT